MKDNTQSESNTDNIISKQSAGGSYKSADGPPKKEARRTFLKSSVGVSTLLATGASLTAASGLHAQGLTPLQPTGGIDNDYRALQAANLKLTMAEDHFGETILLQDQESNEDEGRYEDDRFYASYSKSLPCNQYGEVQPSAFRKLRRALRRGREEDFNNIVLHALDSRPLVSPQASFKFETCGLDSHGTRMAPSHTFRSAEIAAETAEVYWQAITRDVPYLDFQTNSLIGEAVADLNNFSATPGATNFGATDVDLLFRGETPGDLVGPYISQFLLNDVIFGPVEFVQRYQQPTTAQDFMADTANWLNVQRGGTPAEPMTFDPVRRYIYNGRTLGEYVHRDVSFQAYLNACAQLLALGNDAVDQGNPYINQTTTQEGFVTFGAPFAVDLVTRVANLAFTGAWFQKWRVHRFLRPEAYAGRVHFNLTGSRNYELHGDILNSNAVQKVFSQNGTYLLPQGFSEGSPTHPSYPAGHACVAGACVTALKAYFNEDYVLSDTVQADAEGLSLIPYNGQALTVGGELNKLANNIALGRDAAGVHYRQDGIQGLQAGEQQAIAYIKDQSRTLKEANNDGFYLTKFDGTRINIKNGVVSNV